MALAMGQYFVFGLWYSLLLLKHGFHRQPFLFCSSALCLLLLIAILVAVVLGWSLRSDKFMWMSLTVCTSLLFF
jgi:hypothetical protein